MTRGLTIFSAILVIGALKACVEVGMRRAPEAVVTGFSHSAPRAAMDLGVGVGATTADHSFAKGAGSLAKKGGEASSHESWTQSYIHNVADDTFQEGIKGSFNPSSDDQDDQQNKRRHQIDLPR